MEIVLIIIFFCLMLYAFSKSSGLKKELIKKDSKINSLTNDINQFKIEISNCQSDKRSLNDKYQRLRTELSNLQIDKRAVDEKNVQLKNHNDALSKYQDIINVQTECEYLLKKAEKERIKLTERAHWSWIMLSYRQKNLAELQENIPKKERER